MYRKLGTDRIPSAPGVWKEGCGRELITYNIAARSAVVRITIGIDTSARAEFLCRVAGGRTTDVAWSRVVNSWDNAVRAGMGKVGETPEYARDDGAGGERIFTGLDRGLGNKSEG